MFHSIHRRLTLLCTGITAVIVLGILFLCLSISERSLKEQEQALFLLQADAITMDLHTRDKLDIPWYQNHMKNGIHPLLITADGQPLTLSTLLLTEENTSLLTRVQQSAACEDAIADAPSYRAFWQTDFSYTDDDGTRYFVMYAYIPVEQNSLHYMYLYPLDQFLEQIIRQRMIFGGIWLLSVITLGLFAWFFTGHVLRPVMRNHLKQKQFIAHASHELRAPLAVIKTGLSLLETSPPHDKAAHFRQLMSHETNRMERLVSDLLFLSKADETSWTYKPQRTNMNDLARNCYHKYLPVMQEKQQHFRLLVPEHPACICLCDQERLEQVLTILLANAHSYTPEQGTIQLLLTRTRTRCMLQVIDDGPGLTATEKEKVFDRFYQTDAAHNDKDHSGLGLSIAREICRAHHYDLTVTDTPGGGCTFTIFAAII